MIPLLTAAEIKSVLGITTIIMPTLFAAIALGLVVLRLRAFALSRKVSDDFEGQPIPETQKIGVDELLPELQSFYDRSAFREGPILIYLKLRSQIVTALNLSSLVAPTERETVEHILSLSTKRDLKIDKDLWTLYAIYEKAKFSGHLFTEEDLSKTANLYSSLWTACSLGE